MRQPTLIFATFLAPVLYKTCLYITEYIEQYTGIPTFLLPERISKTLRRKLSTAGFSAAWLTSS